MNLHGHVKSHPLVACSSTTKDITTTRTTNCIIFQLLRSNKIVHELKELTYTVYHNKLINFRKKIHTHLARQELFRRLFLAPVNSMVITRKTHSQISP